MGPFYCHNCLAHTFVNENLNDFQQLLILHHSEFKKGYNYVEGKQQFQG